jgi:hypothetical protein
MRFILVALLIIFSTTATAASVTLRYWNGDATAQISGLKNVSACKKLARQKGLSSTYYYCIETGKPFDRSFERKNGWN